MKYQVTVEGELDESWGNWLGKAEVTVAVGAGKPRTTLRADLPDQPALMGLLNRLADLNLVLISVQQLAEPERGERHS